MTLMLTPSMAGWIAFCIATETGREVCFKHAAINHSGMRTVLNGVSAAGILCWFVELVAWSHVLQTVPLSLAFPIMASSYVTIAVAAALVFNETINLRHAFGILLVTAGVVCVGVTGL